MAKKISGKKNTQAQLDAWANQNNPNNKAYRTNANNHANQLNPKRKTHQQRHNSDRRYRDYMLPEWAPDYIEYDD